MRMSVWSSDVCSSDLPEALLERLRPVIAAHGVLRVKGFAAVTGKAMRLVVQGVGERLQHYYDRDWRPGEARATRLVFIGETGLDEAAIRAAVAGRSEEHTSELQSLMRISYAVFCLEKKKA